MVSTRAFPSCFTANLKIKNIMDKSVLRSLADKFNQLPEEKKKSVIEELNTIDSETDSVDNLDNLMVEFRNYKKFSNNQP